MWAIVRLSRHCYDKPHRCPGWAGGGWTYSKVGRCDNGRIQIDYAAGWWKWQFHRCTTCDVVCWPIVVQWLDYTWWRWILSRRRDQAQEQLLWPAQRFIVIALWLLCELLDHIPVARRGEDGKWHRTTAQWGCWPLRLATMSDKLDQRWKTRVWEPVPEGEEKHDNHIVR